MEYVEEELCEPGPLELWSRNRKSLVVPHVTSKSSQATHLSNQMKHLNTDRDSHLYILVTGSNTGLGFAICRRLVDEFIHTRSESEKLTLIVTARDEKKCAATVKQLGSYLENATKATTLAKNYGGMVTFESRILDLMSLQSVKALSDDLLSTLPKLDSIILNAGVGGVAGIQWPLAFWCIFTNWKNAVTWPTFRLGTVGQVTKPQLSNTGAVNEPVLGEVFCSNVFGHYLLSHNLVPLLSRSAGSTSVGGRIIWVTSIEARVHHFSIADLQGLATSHAYESSKRLTDNLVLTSSLPSSRPWVDRYLGSADINSKINKGTATSDFNAGRPKIYAVHPGICGTGFVPLSLFLNSLMFLVMYIARWLGSPWHTVQAYKGACAPVWIALSSQEQLDHIEETEGPAKWGSATDFWGSERVVRTEVEGWGYSGVVGQEGKRKGRAPNVKNLTPQAREEFGSIGRECWKEMEELREDWEKRLAKAS
ncbi:MAG: 3-keto-steroid reductase [Pycnora praestabilis]|nr:MAG: 3-keto-steroid reductase [Pycnora praestabilis]